MNSIKIYNVSFSFIFPFLYPLRGERKGEGWVLSLSPFPVDWGSSSSHAWFIYPPPERAGDRWTGTAVSTCPKDVASLPCVREIIVARIFMKYAFTLLVYFFSVSKIAYNNSFKWGLRNKHMYWWNIFSQTLFDAWKLRKIAEFEHEVTLVFYRS